MNPSNKEGSNLLMPIPLPEQPAAAAKMPETPTASAERAGSAAEQAPALAMAPPATTAASGTDLSLPLPTPASTVPTNGATTMSAAAALPADDGDLIEKEWVIRAKQIVDRTRDDPYKQSEDLTLFKADYMKKRYGKTIKVSR